MSDDLAHWVALNSIPGLGPARFAELLRRFGSPGRILLETPAGQLALVSGIGPKMAAQIVRAGENLDKFASYVEKIESDGVRIVTQADNSYPRKLLRAPNPPPVVYLAGSYTRADENSVGIIGTTAPSKKGSEIGRECARRLAGRGCTVVSGYARGIDTSGHLGALDAGGRTVIVLPMGIRAFRPGRGYPRMDQLLSRAAILSEAPPEDEWQRHYALARNRLTAALCERLLVVECGETGGTMHTVRVARKIGVPVYVIRYRKAPVSAKGNEAAASQGAIPVTSFTDIDHLASGDLDPATLTQKQFDW